VVGGGLGCAMERGDERDTTENGTKRRNNYYLKSRRRGRKATRRGKQGEKP